MIMKCVVFSSVGRAVDSGLKGCWFKPYRQRSHCIMSLSKTLYLLLSAYSNQEDPPNMTEKLLTGA